jgi:hypothetical protein
MRPSQVHYQTGGHERSKLVFRETEENECLGIIEGTTFTSMREICLNQSPWKGRNGDMPVGCSGQIAIIL